MLDRLLKISYCALYFICCVHVLVAESNITQLEELFVRFVQKYKKTYQDDTKEYGSRFAVFKQTLERIDYLNQNRDHRQSAFYGITQYADLTPEEFRSKVLGQSSWKRVKRGAPIRNRRSPFTVTAAAQTPSKFDWRDMRVVTGVRNQGSCGGCWAISAVETIETMYAIKTGQLPTLSVQQIIDCAGNGNLGCQGGDTCAALSWMNSTNVHIVPEIDYPFKGVTGSCKAKDPPRGVQISRFSCHDYLNNENLMVDLIANHGPLAVAVDATMWQDYLGGIIKYNCESVHNHAAQIVGYDLTGPVPYFIIRNSWGPEFGLQGYLHVAIGKNLCGIAREVSEMDVI